LAVNTASEMTYYIVLGGTLSSAINEICMID